MPFEQTESGVIITGEKSIELYQWTTIKYAIRLEMRGLKHSRGSVSANSAQHLGLPRRTRKSIVLAAVEAKIEELKANGGLS